MSGRAAAAMAAAWGAGCWLLAGAGIALADSAEMYWAWMSGSDVAAQRGVYGTLGTPGAANGPGARMESATWRDGAGVLWLFGGDGKDSAGDGGKLNDLWAYDPASGCWTWTRGSNLRSAAGAYGTRGVPAAGNMPGARSAAAAWTDAAGRFWLFGGSGYDAARNSGLLNDLWVYDPASGCWTWVCGTNAVNAHGTYGGLGDPNNGPGARGYAAGWADPDGCFWLFGGYGLGSAGSFGHLNDLWKFTPANNSWIWMKGSSTTNHPGVYGLMRTPDTANTPGARAVRAAWVDAAGALWLFGGYRGAGGSKRFNDLWKFDRITSCWTWMKGSSLPNQPGLYGLPGVPGAANNPGGRAGPVGWKDPFGVFWLFGGMGYDGGGVIGWLNDLWRYDPVSDHWTWIKGRDTVNALGTYGARGVPAGANAPGARAYGATWETPSGALWLFGGMGYARDSSSGTLNDLWRFPQVYTLAYSAGANGTLSGPVLQTVAYGADGNAVTAVPAAGFRFAQWSDGATANPRQDRRVTRSLAVTALFGLTPAVPSGAGADYDGDRRADPALYDEASGTWRIKLSAAGYAQAATTLNGLGGPGRAAVDADYDGDRLADPAVYREQTGGWSFLLSSSGYAAAVALPQPLGGPGFSGMPADYDGDGRADPCVVDRARGDWAVLLSSAQYARLDLPRLLGGTGWRAAAADYDGDRLADPAVFGEAAGDWLLLLSGAGYGSLRQTAFLGGPGDVPCAADYDGDSRADPAVHNAAGDQWDLRLSSAGYTPLHVPLSFP